MSYRIVYGPEIKRKTPVEKRWKIWLASGIGAALILLGISGKWNVLQKFFLPGDADVTGAALQGMVDDLKNGDSFSEAVTAFCKVIVENAEIME